MIRYEAIVLAFRNIIANDPPRLSLSAMTNVHGKPLIEWVIDALRSSSRINSITVIGPQELDQLLCMRFTYRRIPTLAEAFDFFLQVARDILTKSEPKSRYIIIPCEAIFISAPVFDKIITSFETEHPDIAIPSIIPERLGRYQSMIKSTVRHEGKTIVPGIFAIAKNVVYISVAFRKLTELHRERDLLRDSGYALQLITTIEEQLGLRTDIRFKFIESEDISVAQFIQNQDDLSIATKVLPKPFFPPFTKVKVIINPYVTAYNQTHSLQNISGKSSQPFDLYNSLDDYQRRIRFYLSEIGIKTEILVVESAEQAYKNASQCAQNRYDLVIAVGSDTTINAIINGLAGSGTTLGIFPSGTFNILALLMDMPTELRAACQVIRRGKVRAIDLGKANGHYFSSLLGIGLDAYPIRVANSKLTRIIGGTAYILRGFFNLLRYHFNTIHLSIDGDIIQHTGFLVVIGNGKYYSPHINISPYTKLDDGLLDIVIFKSRNLLRLITYFWRLPIENLTDLPDVEHYQGKHIVIEQDGNHLMHIDGEVFGHVPVDITIMPSSLKVLC